MDLQEMIDLRDEVNIFMNGLGEMELRTVRKIASILHQDSHAAQTIHSMTKQCSVHWYREAIAQLARKIDDKSLLTTIYNFINRYYRGTPEA